METYFKYLLEVICSELGLFKSHVLGDRRTGDIVKARTYLIVFMKEKYPNIGVVQLGKFINRNHSNIVHLQTNHANSLIYNDYKKEYDNLSHCITGGLHNHKTGLIQDIQKAYDKKTAIELEISIIETAIRELDYKP